MNFSQEGDKHENETKDKHIINSIYDACNN